MGMQLFTELRNKEMICVKDGYKIGYVDDIEFDCETYRILYFISFGKSRFFGLFGRSEDVKISCEQIEVVGEDIILVKDYKRDYPSKPKRAGFLEHIFE